MHNVLPRMLVLSLLFHRIGAYYFRLIIYSLIGNRSVTFSVDNVRR